MTIHAADPPIREAPGRPVFRTRARTRIEAQIRGPIGRARVAGALREVACEAFDLGAGELILEPMPHLREALDASIEAATDGAIDDFLAALRDVMEAVDAADPQVWDKARRRAQLGTE